MSPGTDPCNCDRNGQRQGMSSDEIQKHLSDSPIKKIRVRDELVLDAFLKQGLSPFRGGFYRTSLSDIRLDWKKKIAT